MNSQGEHLRLAVVLDAALEGWTSMDYVGQMLVETLRQEHADAVDTISIQPDVPRVFGNLPGPAHWLRHSADRLVARCVVYPAALARLRKRFDVFHIVDHSYAHVGHVLPPDRTGIYCHDLKALEPLLSGALASPSWSRVLARSILTALQRAAVVFFSTDQVRQQIIRHGLVDDTTLVRAPYGVAPEFRDSPSGDSGQLDFLPSGAFLLHVGSSAPRKRLDLLLRAFALVRKERPDLVLVQRGAQFTSAQKSLISYLGVGNAIFQSRHLTRTELAELYRRAELVVLPSEDEGFGLPIIEALACGALVLCSSIPAFLEVGGEAVSYCSSNEASGWRNQILDLLSQVERLPSKDDRLAQASRFSWSRHAEIVLRSYQGLA